MELVCFDVRKVVVIVGVNVSVLMVVVCFVDVVEDVMVVVKVADELVSTLVVLLR